MKLLLRRRIRACLLRCARSDYSTYCRVRLRNPVVARLVSMPVCAALSGLFAEAGIPQGSAALHSGLFYCALSGLKLLAPILEAS